MAVETLRSGLVAAREVSACKFSREPLSSVRYVASIYTGVTSAFPEQISQSGGRREIYYRINNITPYMIALNEMADIGESAYQAFATGGSTYLRNARLNTRSALKQSVEYTRSEFIRRSVHPDEEAYMERVLDNIGQDFLLLSARREDFRTTPKEMERYLGLDSAIIEAGYIEAAFPRLLRKIGVDIFEQQQEHETDKDYLERKYRLFLSILEDDFDPATLSKRQRSLLGMHAYAMGMKVQDDVTGKDIDQYTGVITFRDVIESEEEIDTDAKLRRKSQNYFEKASKLGMSRTVMNIGAFARSASRRIKGVLSTEVPALDPHEVAPRLTTKRVASSNLRHEIGPVTLSELFTNR